MRRSMRASFSAWLAARFSAGLSHFICRRFVVLNLGDRHFLSGPAVKDGYLVRTQAQSTTRCIQGYITAADDGYSPPDVNRPADLHIP